MVFARVSFISGPIIECEDNVKTAPGGFTTAPEDVWCVQAGQPRPSPPTYLENRITIGSM